MIVTVGLQYKRAKVYAREHKGAFFHNVPPMMWVSQCIITWCRNSFCLLPELSFCLLTGLLRLYQWMLWLLLSHWKLWTSGAVICSSATPFTASVLTTLVRVKEPLGKPRVSCWGTGDAFKHRSADSYPVKIIYPRNPRFFSSQCCNHWWFLSPRWQWVWFLSDIPPHAH